MAKSLLEIFTEECGKLVIDKALVERCESFVKSFVSKNRDHINFFGGNLLGVDKVRWTDVEYNHWFDDILAADDIEIKKGIAQIPEIDPEWKRANDPVNLSMLWLCHAFYNSDLPEALKHRGMIAVMELMQFKFISSLLSHYFPYPADRHTAQTAYTALTKKFDLKMAGDWRRFFHDRAENTITPKSIHYRTIERYDNIKDIIYMVTDIQGRLRAVVKNMAAVFYEIKDSGNIITSSGMLGMDADGLYLKDKQSTFIKYRKYIYGLLGDPKSFIKSDLLAIISKKNPTANPSLVETTLKWMSDNVDNKQLELKGADGVMLTDNYLKRFIDETLIHCFGFVISKRIKLNDLPSLLDKLRSVYMASRTTDVSVLDIRLYGDQLVRAATKLPPARVVSPERTSLALYVVLRALSMYHYRSGLSIEEAVTEGCRLVTFEQAFTAVHRV